MAVVMERIGRFLVVYCLCLACIGVGCADDETRNQPADGECRHGETKKESCNTCACGEDGTWSCTEIDCQNVETRDGGPTDAGERDTGQGDADASDAGREDTGAADKGTTDAGSIDGGEVCEPGEVREVDCNTCVCDDGEWACTEIVCPDAGASDDAG